MTTMSNSALALLRQPFPLNLPTPAAAVRLRLSIGLLVFFILIVLQPFGIATSNKQHLALELSVYGIITFCVLSFFETVVQRMFPSIFKEEAWTVGKAILWLWFIIFIIGIFNALYFWLLYRGNPIAASHSVAIFLQTFLIGIFPFALGILGRFTVLYRTYKKSAEALAVINAPNTEIKVEKDHAVTFFQDNKKTKVLLRASEIYLIESAENYITIHSVVEGELKKMMLRCTLQAAEESVQDTPTLVRCHRSYIANLTKVTDLTGNAQGYKLQVMYLEKPVPVSRKYEKLVIEQLRQVKNIGVSTLSAGIHSSQNAVQSAQG